MLIFQGVYDYELPLLVAQEGYGYLLKLKLWTLTKAMMVHHGVGGNGGGPRVSHVNQDIH